MTDAPRTRRNARPGPAPLYDGAFEHDACGVGFVADAGGRSRDRVLPLALAGLGALGHRGAFAADGESSDGAGVLLPLEPALLERLDPTHAAGDRPAVVSLFLPPGRTRQARARAIVHGALEAEGLELARWRPVPHDPAAVGRAARSSMPAFVHALIRRGDLDDHDLDVALAAARRRIEGAARSVGLDGVSVASASASTIAYKGLVAGSRLAALYPDLQGQLPLSLAVFHQRYATNTHPTWELAQPFGRIAHNGEIDTVRGNREAVRGRINDLGGSRRARAAAARLLAAGPPLSPGVSDSRSLDELLELLTATGWSLDRALLAAMPEALGIRRAPHPAVAAFQRRTAGFIAPWDGPAAIVFSDGRRVGAILDRNGLRPAAWAETRDHLVTIASEAGAVPLDPGEIVRTGRLGPGEMLLVEPGTRTVRLDGEAKSWALRRLPVHDVPRRKFADRLEAGVPSEDAGTPVALRYLFGVDAERVRQDVRTMAIEAHEPLWSMGDDTPLAGRARVDRPASDHLRQAFAQVTNPPIDPERERVVLDLRVELGPRPALLGGLPAGPTTTRLDRPVVADLDTLLTSVGVDARDATIAARDVSLRRVARLDATWDAAEGPEGLGHAIARLADDAVKASEAGAAVVLIDDRRASLDGDGRLPVASVLATGAVQTALTNAGRRGWTDVVVDAGDLLDVHGVAMVLAAGATVVRPRLLLELAAELAGTRGAEAITPTTAIENVLTALDAGLRKVLARMGISTIASAIGGQLFETLELGPELVSTCFPAAAAWPGRLEATQFAIAQLRRLAEARAVAPAVRTERLPDPGLTRYRADGELHLFSRPVATSIQALASEDEPAEAALARYRSALARGGAVVRDGWAIRGATGVDAIPLALVEPASEIARRFVVSAMSVGALSPEAHRALTRGIQMIGGAANTGEGGEDPAWYAPGPNGERLDSRIKQVASARFGVTAAYLARADQLEIKIAQGSKPGEGGQLPGRKATPYIASLRRAQPGQSLISPPPHHDIYSIEDLAQLIADLRAINARARIGVKLVATRGVGTIASGVVKAGADYVHLSGHAGGTGASPLSSIKHVGAPWELGLAEVHQTLLRNDLRDRVALRTDGGLQTGRDLLIAALLGAEEFAFGTSALIAVGCDMARQCHLDTCPTGIATQRDDLRAKFTGTPDQVARFFLRIAEDLRRELAAVGARSVGEVVGRSRLHLRSLPGSTIDLRAVAGAPDWNASPARRQDPASAGRSVGRAPASPLEGRLVGALSGQGGLTAAGLRLTTAERSFGAALSGAVERGEVRPTVRLELSGAAGQSFGAFASTGLRLTLDGVANDGVAKGLSGGVVIVRPPSGTADERPALAGNACLYGATAGRLHVIGRAGIRFAVRSSGAEAVVEGIGAHGCEYMTGGVVVVLGPVGPNFGAGMTGGRAYLWDPDERHLAALHGASVTATRLATVADARSDGADRADELRRLLEQHADAGSRLAERLVATWTATRAGMWLVEPVAASVTSTVPAVVKLQPTNGTEPDLRPAAPVNGSAPNRNLHAPAPTPSEEPDAVRVA
ncbi:MAG: glutamate synthase large subunit [Chloroflexota bacterium]